MGATLADAIVLSSDIFFYLRNTFCVRCYGASVTLNFRLPFRLDFNGGADVALAFGPGVARGSDVLVCVVCAASCARAFAFALGAGVGSAGSVLAAFIWSKPS